MIFKRNIRIMMPKLILIGFGSNIKLIRIKFGKLRSMDKKLRIHFFGVIIQGLCCISNTKLSLQSPSDFWTRTNMVKWGNVLIYIVKRSKDLLKSVWYFWAKTMKKIIRLPAKLWIFSIDRAPAIRNPILSKRNRLVS